MTKPEKSAPGPQPEGELIHIQSPMPLAMFGPSAGPVFWASWPQETDQQRALSIQCLADPDYKSEDVIGAEILVENVFMHPYQHEDEETGELIDVVRVVLIQPGGETVAFSSKGAHRCILAILQAWPKTPWVPPLRLKVKQVSTRKSRRTFNLLVVGIGDTNFAQSKKGKQK